MSLKVTRSLEIPDEELQLSFSTSSGPGGQHANKAATRVSVTWNPSRSAVLGPRQRARLEERLATRIDQRGDITVVSERYRSQLRNREDALGRLAQMLGNALKVEKQRRATKPTRSATEKRLAGKKRRSEIKRARRAPRDNY